MSDDTWADLRELLGLCAWLAVLGTIYLARQPGPSWADLVWGSAYDVLEVGKAAIVGIAG